MAAQQIHYNGFEIYYQNGNFFIKGNSIVSFRQLDLIKDYIDEINRQTNNR